MPDNGFASNRMKKIEAITKPFKLDAVIEALKDFGISHLTFYEIWEIEKEKGHTDLYRGAEYFVDFIPKIKIELFVSDNITKQVVSIIKEKAQIEEYEEAIKKAPSRIDWSLLKDFEKEDTTSSSQTFACSGDSCEVVDIGV